MMLLFLIILVAAYAATASWASHYGQARLWLTAAAAFLLIVAFAVMLGRRFDVPSLFRLLLYALTLTGPIVLVPTAMLSLFASSKPAPVKALPTAILGACLGLACGFVMAVFGLGMWW